MGVLKLVDSTLLDSNLTSIANAIRTKGNTQSQLAFPNGFISAINNIFTGIIGVTAWMPVDITMANLSNANTPYLHNVFVGTSTDDIEMVGSIKLYTLRNNNKKVYLPYNMYFGVVYPCWGIQLTSGDGYAITGFSATSAGASASFIGGMSCGVVRVTQANVTSISIGITQRED